MPTDSLARTRCIAQAHTDITIYGHIPGQHDTAVDSVAILGVNAAIRVSAPIMGSISLSYLIQFCKMWFYFNTKYEITPEKIYFLKIFPRIGRNYIVEAVCKQFTNIGDCKSKQIHHGVESDASADGQL